MPPDIGQLLRLKGEVDAAAAAPADGLGAPALVDAYNGLRVRVARALDGDPRQEEFIDAFAELPAATTPLSNQPYNVRKAAVENESLARRAQLDLGRLAGWLDGMIGEQTLERRMQLEAQERVRQERRPPTGFSGG
jgi:hypothetical protein